MKKRFERVAILLAFVMVGFGGAYAQEAGDKAAGVNLVYGTGNLFSSMGIGAKFQYNVTKPVRGEVSFTCFWKNLAMSFWDVSVDAHYLFAVTEKINLYPIAGFGVMGLTDSNGQMIDLGGGTLILNKNDGSYSQAMFGVNLGGGAEYKLTSQFYLNAGIKYRIGIFDTADKAGVKTPFGNSVRNYYDSYLNRLMISAGIAYKF